MVGNEAYVYAEIHRIRYPIFVKNTSVGDVRILDHRYALC